MYLKIIVLGRALGFEATWAIRVLSIRALRPGDELGF
jgi:hypothetical protein